MKDCCGKEIVVNDVHRLRVARNRHPNCNGTSWGWIEGTNGGYWSDDKPFDSTAAASFVARMTETGCKGHCASCTAIETLTLRGGPEKPHA